MRRSCAMTGKTRDKARIAAGNRSVILLMEFGGTAQVVCQLLAIPEHDYPHPTKPGTQPVVLGGLNMLFRVTGIILLGTLAVAGQTSTPGLKDTEQPHPA